MNDRWGDLIGMTGVAIIIVTYFLLQTDKIRSSSVGYSACNALGAGMVMVSLFFDFNLSAFIVELFWAAISLYGIFRHLGRKK